MSLMNKNTALVGALAFAAKTAAHGIVTGIVADGVYNLGYDPSFQYQNPPPAVAGWSIPQVQDRGFAADLNGPDIVCHRGATPGKAYIQVAAGGKLEFQWTEWPVSHHGPMIDYLAPCPGNDCTTVDKTSLSFTKVAEAGLNDGSTPPGNWASDDLIANNNTWVVDVPSDVAPGKYVWRHETIALHSAHESKGAQAYPQCVNIEITGSGSNDYTSGGTPATELYDWSDAGIAINIYQKLSNYVIPGPPLKGSGSSGPTKPSTGFPAPSGNGTAPFPTGGAGNGPKPTAPTTTAAAATTTAYEGDEDEETLPTTILENVGTTTTTTAATGPTSAAEEVDTPTTTQSPPKPTGGAGNGNGEGDGEVELPTKPTGISFSSTVTGRIGKPTKFVCYAEVD